MSTPFSDVTQLPDWSCRHHLVTCHWLSMQIQCKFGNLFHRFGDWGTARVEILGRAERLRCLICRSSCLGTLRRRVPHSSGRIRSQSRPPSPGRCQSSPKRSVSPWHAVSPEEFLHQGESSWMQVGLCRSDHWWNPNSSTGLCVWGGGGRSSQFTDVVASFKRSDSSVTRIFALWSGLIGAVPTLRGFVIFAVLLSFKWTVPAPACQATEIMTPLLKRAIHFWSCCARQALVGCTDWIVWSECVQWLGLPCNSCGHSSTHRWAAGLQEEISVQRKFGFTLQQNLAGGIFNLLWCFQSDEKNFHLCQTTRFGGRKNSSMISSHKRPISITTDFTSPELEKKKKTFSAWTRNYQLDLWMSIMQNSTSERDKWVKFKINILKVHWCFS